MRKMESRPARRPWFPCLIFVLLLTLLPLPGRVCAAENAAASAATTPASLTGDFKSAIVVDAQTGLVLVATNERERRQPASMLKMMTELIVLEHVAAGDLKMDDLVEVSAKASRMGGSQVYLKQGEKFAVVELLHALAIHSANDAAAALAEHVAGSTDAFVDLMNMKAKDLGMVDTRFQTVHGLPPAADQEPDLTTAYDLSLLARELVKHPEALEWGSTERMPFRGGAFTLYNPNKLVGKYRGLDGLKTGYTAPAGFCVTATAIQKGKRLVSVVMGCSTDRARATETTRLLTYGFNAYEQVTVVPEAGVTLDKPVALRGGKKKQAIVAYGETLTVSVPRGREGDLELRPELPDRLEAPLAARERVGRAVVLLDGLPLGEVPLVVTEEYPKGNWLDRLLN